MKLRSLFIAVLACMLAGCGSSNSTATAEKEVKETSKPQETAKPAEEKTPAPTVSSEPEPEEDIKLVIWAHDPDLALDGVNELTTSYIWPSFESVTCENVGYPQEWKGFNRNNEGRIAILNKNYEKIDSFRISRYISDAIAVCSDGYWGITDYDGNVLCPPYTEDTISDALGSGFIASSYGPDPSPAYFLSDFTTVLVRTDSDWGGVGGIFPMGYAYLNHQLVNGNSPSDASPVSTIEAAEGYRCLLRIVEDDGSEYGKTVGYAAFDENSNHLFDIYDLYPVKYVNGFCSFSETQGVYSYEINDYISGTKAFWNMKTGEQITDFLYDDAKWFEDGFCPVKRDGKWGFIDETGKEVTDMIWDDVSALYEGKTYVGLDGTYGILDLKGTVEAGIPITKKNCYPAGVSTGKILQKGNMPCDILGAAFVKVDELNSRNKPSTSGELLEQTENGYAYPVYEISENEGYTWYRIDTDRWIADKNGNWVKYIRKETEK